MNFWQSVPFARITIPFAIGILLAEMNAFSPLAMSAFFMGAGIVSKVFSMYEKIPMRMQFHLKGIALLATLLSLGILHNYLSDERNQRDYFELLDGEILLVKVSGRPEVREKNIRMDAEVLAIHHRNTWKACSGKIKLYLRDRVAKNVQAGDWIQLDRNAVSKPLKVLNPYAFDYERYLHLNGIHNTAFPDSSQWTSTGIKKPNPFLQKVYDLQDYLHMTYSQYFEDKNDRGIMEALTFGYKAELDQKSMEVYSKTGVIHVLAVSGLHVGLIYSCLQFLTFFLSGTPMRRNIRAVIVILGLTGYAFVTGLSPSVNRAVVMFIMFVVAEVTGKSNHSLNSLFSSAFILLTINPLLLFHAGFQLSYLAVAGILLIHPGLEKLIHVKNKWLKKITTLITVSIAAQLATFPLCIYIFQQFPNYFLPANLIAIPITTLLLILGSILPVLHPFVFLEPVSATISTASELLLRLNRNVLEFISNLPLALTENLYLTTFETCLLYGCIASVWSYSKFRKATMLWTSVFFICTMGINHTVRIYNNGKTKGWMCFIHKNICIPAYKNGRDLIVFAQNDQTNAEAFEPFYRAKCGGKLEYRNLPFPSKNSLVSITVDGKKKVYITRSLYKKHFNKIEEDQIVICISPLKIYEEPSFLLIAPRIKNKVEFSGIHDLSQKGFWHQTGPN